MGVLSSGGSFHCSARMPAASVWVMPSICDSTAARSWCDRRLLVDFAVLLAEHLVQHQHADVHQQRGQEALFLLDQVHLGGDGAGRGGGVDAAPPVGQVLEALGLGLGQVGHQREAQHQRLDRLQPQDHQRMGDGADALAAAVEAGVDRAEDLGGQRRVLGDDVRDLGDVHLVLLGQFQHLDRDRRQRRQRRALPNALDQLLVHSCFRTPDVSPAQYGRHTLTLREGEATFVVVSVRWRRDFVPAGTEAAGPRICGSSIELVAAEGVAEVGAADGRVVDDLAGVPSLKTWPSLMIRARSQTLSVWATL